MKAAIGCTTRPYGMLSYPDAFARIAAAGYQEVAVFRSKEPVGIDRDIAFTLGYVRGILAACTQTSG